MSKRERDEQSILEELEKNLKQREELELKLWKLEHQDELWDQGNAKQRIKNRILELKDEETRLKQALSECGVKRLNQDDRIYHRESDDSLPVAVSDERLTEDCVLIRPAKPNTLESVADILSQISCPPFSPPELGSYGNEKEFNNCNTYDINNDNNYDINNDNNNNNNNSNSINNRSKNSNDNNSHDFPAALWTLVTEGVYPEFGSYTTKSSIEREFLACSKVPASDYTCYVPAIVSFNLNKQEEEIRFLLGPSTKDPCMLKVVTISMHGKQKNSCFITSKKFRAPGSKEALPQKFWFLRPSGDLVPDWVLLSWNPSTKFELNPAWSSGLFKNFEEQCEVKLTSPSIEPWSLRVIEQPVSLPCTLMFRDPRFFEHKVILLSMQTTCLVVEMNIRGEHGQQVLAQHNEVYMPFSSMEDLGKSMQDFFSRDIEGWDKAVNWWTGLCICDVGEHHGLSIGSFRKDWDVRAECVNAKYQLRETEMQVLRKQLGFKDELLEIPGPTNCESGCTVKKMCLDWTKSKNSKLAWIRTLATYFEKRNVVFDDFFFEHSEKSKTTLEGLDKLLCELLKLQAGSEESDTEPSICRLFSNRSSCGRSISLFLLEKSGWTKSCENDRVLFKVKEALSQGLFTDGELDELIRTGNHQVFFYALQRIEKDSATVWSIQHENTIEPGIREGSPSSEMDQKRDICLEIKKGHEDCEFFDTVSSDDKQEEEEEEEEEEKDKEEQEQQQYENEEDGEEGSKERQREQNVGRPESRFDEIPECRTVRGVLNDLPHLESAYTNQSTADLVEKKVMLSLWWSVLHEDKTLANVRADVDDFQKKHEKKVIVQNICKLFLEELDACSKINAKSLDLVLRERETELNLMQQLCCVRLSESIERNKTKANSVLFNFSACGSGKTLSYLAGMRAVKAKRVVVIAPSTLLSQWNKELTGTSGRLKGIECRTFCISDYKVEKTEALTKWVQEMKDQDRVIYAVLISYHSLSSETGSNLMNAVRMCNADFVILDECHRVKNANTKWTDIISKYLEDVRSKAKIMAGSATPLINSVSEFLQMWETVSGVSSKDIYPKRGGVEARDISSLNRVHFHLIANQACLKWRVNFDSIVRWHGRPDMGSAHGSCTRCDNLTFDFNPDIYQKFYASLPRAAYMRFEIHNILMAHRATALKKYMKHADGVKFLVYTHWIGKDAEEGKSDDSGKEREQESKIVHAIEHEFGNEFRLYTFLGSNDVRARENRMAEFKTDASGKKSALLISRIGQEGLDGLQECCNELVFWSLPETWSALEQVIGRLWRHKQQSRLIHVGILRERHNNFPPDKSYTWSCFKAISKKEELSRAVVDGVYPEGFGDKELSFSKESVCYWLFRFLRDSKSPLQDSFPQVMCNGMAKEIFEMGWKKRVDWFKVLDNFLLFQNFVKKRNDNWLLPPINEPSPCSYYTWVWELLRQNECVTEHCSILDAGCGAGFFAGSAPEHVTVFSLDLMSYEDIAANIEGFEKRVPRERYVQGSYMDIAELTNNRFDVILFSFSFGTRKKVLQNALKSVKKQGVVVFLDFNPCNISPGILQEPVVLEEESVKLRVRVQQDKMERIIISATFVRYAD